MEAELLTFIDNHTEAAEFLMEQDWSNITTVIKSVLNKSTLVGQVEPVIYLILTSTLNAGDQCRTLHNKILEYVLDEVALGVCASTNVSLAVALFHQMLDHMGESDTEIVFNKLLSYIVMENISGRKIFELLPKVVVTLEDLGYSLKEDCPYKRLLSLNWHASHAVTLANVFSNWSCNRQQFTGIQLKLLSLLENIADDSQWPSLVYNVILAVDKSHMNLVMEAMNSFFTGVMKKLFHISQQHANNPTTTLRREKRRVAQCLGNVSIHILCVFKQKQSVARDFLKYVKTLAPEDIAGNFNFLLLLLIGNLPKLQTQALEVLWQAIRTTFSTEIHRQSYAMLQHCEMEGRTVDELEPWLMMTAEQCCEGNWSCIAEPLLKLSLDLVTEQDRSGQQRLSVLDSGLYLHQQPTSATSSVSTPLKSMTVQRSHLDPLSEKVCHVARSLLLVLFKTVEMMRQTLLNQVMNRVLNESRKPTVFVFLEILAIICSLSERNEVRTNEGPSQSTRGGPIVEIPDSILTSTMSQWHLLPSAVGLALVHAIVPLLQATHPRSRQLTDRLMITLRKMSVATLSQVTLMQPTLPIPGVRDKGAGSSSMSSAMFMEQQRLSSCEMSVATMLMLLKYLTVSNPWQQLSNTNQNNNPLFSQCTQMPTEFSSAFTSTTEGCTATNDGLCSELLVLLRRAAERNPPLRSLIYRGLFEALQRNHGLAEPVVQFLLSRAQNFCPALAQPQSSESMDDGVSKMPLSLNEAVLCDTSGRVSLVEPLDSLMYHLQKAMVYCVNHVCAEALRHVDFLDDDVLPDSPPIVQNNKENSNVVSTAVASRKDFLSVLARLPAAVHTWVETMAHAELEDFSMNSESTEFNASTPTGRKNLLQLLVLLNSYDACIDFALLNQDTESSRSGGVVEECVLNLFVQQQRLEKLVQQHCNTSAIVRKLLPALPGVHTSKEGLLGHPLLTLKSLVGACSTCLHLSRRDNESGVADAGGDVATRERFLQHFLHLALLRLSNLGTVEPITYRDRDEILDLVLTLATSCMEFYHTSLERRLKQVISEDGNIDVPGAAVPHGNKSSSSTHSPPSVDLLCVQLLSRAFTLVEQHMPQEHLRQFVHRLQPGLLLQTPHAAANSVPEPFQATQFMLLPATQTAATQIRSPLRAAPAGVQSKSGGLSVMAKVLKLWCQQLLQVYRRAWIGGGGGGASSNLSPLVLASLSSAHELCEVAPLLVQLCVVYHLRVSVPDAPAAGRPNSVVLKRVHVWLCKQVLTQYLPQVSTPRDAAPRPNVSSSVEQVHVNVIRCIVQQVLRLTAMLDGAVDVAQQSDAQRVAILLSEDVHRLMGSVGNSMAGSVAPSQLSNSSSASNKEDLNYFTLSTRCVSQLMPLIFHYGDVKAWLLEWMLDTLARTSARITDSSKMQLWPGVSKSKSTSMGGHDKSLVTFADEPGRDLDEGPEQGVTNEEHNLRREEKTICIGLSQLVELHWELAQSAFSPGPHSDTLMRSLTRLYGMLATLTKHFVKRWREHKSMFPQQFVKLVQFTGQHLSASVYIYITYVQMEEVKRLQQRLDGKEVKKAKPTPAATTSKAANGKKLATGGKRGRKPKSDAAPAAEPAAKKAAVAPQSGPASLAAQVSRSVKDSRIIPNLIFSVEQFERHAMRLGKLAKVHLIVQLPLARDFNITEHAVNKALEKIVTPSDSGEEDVQEIQEVDLDEPMQTEVSVENEEIIADSDADTDA